MNRLRASVALALLVALGMAGCGQRSSPKSGPISDEAILALKPEGTHAVIVRATGYGTGTIAIADPSLGCVTYDWDDSLHYSQVCWAYVPIAITSVTVTASATNGSLFTGWGGPCAAATGATCVVPTDRDQTFNVGFAPGGAIGPKSAYLLSVHVLGMVDGSISAPPGVGLDCQPSELRNYVRTCTAVVPSTSPPTAVTLTATPTIAGTRFAGWGGNCSGTGTCVVTLDVDRGVTAVFERVPAPDTTPPRVFLTAPSDGAALSGAVAVTASVVDDRGVAGVELVVDGARTGLPFVQGPAGVYGTTLDASALAAGGHTLQVCATDTSANTSCSATIGVTVPAPPGVPQWRVVPYPAGFPPDARAVWGTGPNDVWVGAHDPGGVSGTTVAFAHWDGAGWTTWTTSPAFQPNALSGSGPNDVWAAGDGGRVAHWDGSGWTTSWVSSSAFTYRLNAISFGSSADGWVFGDSYYAQRWDGTGWTTYQTNVAYAMLGGGARFAGAVWAVGAIGATTRCATASVPASTPASACAGGYWALDGDQYDIWGTALNDYWVVAHWAGSGGTCTGALRHESNGGAGWDYVASGPDFCLSALWGSASSDVWAVGRGGAIWHWDGAALTSSAGVTTAPLADVWGSGPADVWAVGNGVILRYSP